MIKLRLYILLKYNLFLKYSLIKCLVLILSYFTCISLQKLCLPWLHNASTLCFANYKISNYIQISVPDITSED